MKPGDIVKLPPMVDRAIIHSINGNEAEIWWPCPEYGHHTRIVDIADLVALGGRHEEARPARKKDHPHGPEFNVQRVTIDLKPSPESQI